MTNSPECKYVFSIRIWSNTRAAYCGDERGLAASNNMTGHKDEDKPLLFQPMLPLDLVCLRDCQKNAFIIPQNKMPRISSAIMTI